jgi:hypothetical protein
MTDERVFDEASCLNHPLNTLDQTSKDALPFSVGNAIQNLSGRFKEVDLIGDLLSDQPSLSFLKQIEVRWRDIRE